MTLAEFAKSGEKYLAALDLGGTKAEALIFDGEGKIIAYKKGEGGIPFDIGAEKTKEKCKKILAEIIKEAGKPVSVLYGAIATVEFYHEEFQSYFEENFDIGKIRLEGDGCSLISAELGHEDGASLICGTGSALYIRKGDEYKRLGGGGQLIDSAGSGYTLARLAMRAVLRAHDDVAPKTMLTELINAQSGTPLWDNLAFIHEKGRAYIASYAKNLFEARKKGDAVANEIFEECANDLANIVKAARRRIGGGFDLVLNGGIFAHFPEYAKRIESLCPLDINFIRSPMPPVYGCAVEAMYDAGLPCDGKFKENFIKTYPNGSKIPAEGNFGKIRGKNPGMPGDLLRGGEKTGAWNGIRE